jgi:hypothetical protein
MEGGNEAEEWDAPIPCPTSASGVLAEAKPEVRASPAPALRKKLRREGILSSNDGRDEPGTSLI